jgi:hypothetical protein
MYGQSLTGDSCIDLLKANTFSQTNIKHIFSVGSVWDCSVCYDVVRDSFVFRSKELKVIRKHKVGYITQNDKLKYRGKGKIEIIFGGKGPERQIFVLRYFDGNCLILESTFAHEGRINGKKVYYKKQCYRYLFRKK